MSYDAETAKKPLTGERYDILILQEREQRHVMGTGAYAGRCILPSAEYCELRDMYKKLVEERDGQSAYGDGPEDMTVEQAIAVLDPETSRAALHGYQYYGGFCGKEARLKACEQACRIAAAVMRKEVSRQRLEADKHCRECICPSCERFQKDSCLEGDGLCEKCDHESHTGSCPWYTSGWGDES